MRTDQALTAPPPMNLAVLPDSQVQRVGGLILRILDRSGVPQMSGLSFSRVVVVCERVVVYYLPISYSEMFGVDLDQRLLIDTLAVQVRLIGGRAGCALVVEIIKTEP